ncbi:MAG: hypothetical protein U0324_43995 [Polyangiales bacterium]
MNAPLHTAAGPAPAPSAVVPLVRLVIPRDAWAFVADSLRAAARGTDVTWSVRRTAASAVLPNGSAVFSASLRALADMGLAPVIVDAAAPQCVGCGCVDALACDGGCSWVGLARCSSCAEPKRGARRRIAKVLVRHGGRR